MQQTDNIYTIDNNDFDEDLNIDFKKIYYTLWNRKTLILKVFIAVLAIFVTITFFMPKKYKVTADLYINKANNSNMAEINPYVIEELGSNGGMSAMLSGSGGNLSNELELMQSPKVIDKVIKENNLKVKKKKKWFFFDNPRYGEYISTEAFLKKNISFENKKGTNVVTIEYKNKDREVAYAVVNSIINNCIELHKQFNMEKSQADLKILEEEYNNAKADLNKKMNSLHGIPQTAMGGTGNITAMSAFSKSAQKALSNIQGQYVAGEKSQIALQEESAKVTQLATKLEWAKLVQSMSTSSKIIVLKEPKKLRAFEYSSPKLKLNILLGIIFGFILSLIAVILKETTDKKLTYSMLGEKVLYNFKEEFIDFQALLLENDSKKIAYVCFENIPENIISKSADITILKAEVTKEFKSKLESYDAFILFESINKTNSKEYKLLKNMILNTDKEIITEVLI